MVIEPQNIQLPVGTIFADSWFYMKSKPLAMLLFSLLNFLILLAGFYSWSHPGFLPLLLVAYLFWSYFFRFYFGRQPYLQLKPLLNSLAPSTKIVFIGALVISALVLLPFVPYFLGFSPDYIDRYSYFLQKYMQESQVVDLILNLLLVFLSPLIFYRPFFAWISALLGRNRTLKMAWNRSRDNYWPLLQTAIFMNFSFVLIELICNAVHLPQALELFLISPLMVYFNIVIARAYIFFFD